VFLELGGSWELPAHRGISWMPVSLWSNPFPLNIAPGDGGAVDEFLAVSRTVCLKEEKLGHGAPL